jgi:hypothetical protein
MNASETSGAAAAPHFLLRFQSLFDEGRALAFPCDERGVVEVERLSERARRNYDFARRVVGRDFASPAVVVSTADLH